MCWVGGCLMGTEVQLWETEKFWRRMVVMAARQRERT